MRILLVLILVSQMSFAEESIETETAAARQIGLKPFFKIPLFGFSLTPRLSDEGEDDERADNAANEFQPNVTPVFGMALLYNGLQISVSAPLQMDEEELKSKGKTRYNDFDFQYMKDHWGVDLGWYRYKGFYKEDEGDLEVYQQHSDMHREGKYVNLFVMPLLDIIKDLHAHKFSGSSVHKKEFSWSPIVQVSYEDSFLHSQTPFLTGPELSLFKSDANLTQINIQSLGASAGALGSYHFQAVKMWMAMTMGVASQKSSFLHNDSSTEESHTRLSGLNISMRLGMDHEWKDWKMGMNMIMDLKEYKLKHSDLNTDVGSITIFGVRKLGI